MSRIVRLSAEHEAALVDFFAAIDRPEIRVNFEPHAFTREEAARRCAYSGKDEYYATIDDEAKIVAYGMLRGWDEGYQVPALGICVRPGENGKGLGTGMMERLIAAARARAAPRVILKVKKQNVPAISFYRSFGFALTDLDADNWRGTLALKGEVDLSLIIPAVNEAENLKVLVPGLKEAISREKAALEIVVIDWHSTDGTAALARELGCVVLNQSAPGYAQAIRDGIAAARGDYVIVMDADQSHTPEDVRRLFSHRDDADIVINSRYVPGGGSDTDWWRDSLSRLLNFLYRNVLGLPYREISGGFRVYRREILKRIRVESRFYEVQEELIIKAHWLGYRAIEIPYRYRERVHGVSKARVLEYGFNLLKALIRFRREAPRGALSPAARSAAASALFFLSCSVSTWSIVNHFEGGVAQEFCHYGEIGRNIIQGRGYRTSLVYPSTLAYMDAHAISFDGTAPVIDRFPLFAYVVAASEKMAGESDAAIAIVSVVLLGLWAAATFEVGCRFFGAWSGAAAGLFVALNPSFQRGFVLWSYPDFLFSILVLGSIALIARSLDEPDAEWSWVAAGAFSGLAWLTRSNLKLWLPLFFGALWLPSVRARAWRRVPRFFAGMLLVALPAIAYNLKNFGTLDCPGVGTWLPQFVVTDGMPGAFYRLFDPWEIVRDHFPALMKKFFILLGMHLRGFPTFWQMNFLFPLALIGTFQPMTRKARRLVILSGAMLAVQVPVFSLLRYEILGSKVGGRYFLWLAPVAFLLAVHGARSLAKRIGLRWLASLLVAANLAFFIAQLATPQGATVHPQGIPVSRWPELAAAAAAAGERGLVATNIPGPVVWYARRPALSIPQDFDEFSAVDRRHPVAAILLSRLSIGELAYFPVWRAAADDARVLERFARDHGFRVVKDFGTAVVLRSEKLAETGRGKLSGR